MILGIYLNASKSVARKKSGKSEIQVIAAGFKITTIKFVNKHWSVWLNGIVFIKELSGCELKHGYNHLNTCSEQQAC